MTEWGLKQKGVIDSCSGVGHTLIMLDLWNQCARQQLLASLSVAAHELVHTAGCVNQLALASVEGMRRT